MNQRLAIILVLSLLTSFQAAAGVNGRVDAVMRSKPIGYNLLGTVAYDGLIWGSGEKNDPMYGFYKIGGKVGGIPTAAAFLQVAPIAPLVFEVQRGTTYRFINHTTDCDIYECYKKVDRTDYSVKLGAGFGKFVFSGRATWREIDTEESTKSAVYLELENFHVAPGYHTFFDYNATVGYKLDDVHTVGGFYNAGTISSGDREFKAGYGFYSVKAGDYSVTGAVGHYDIDDLDRFKGFSAILMVSRAWGDSLSLW